MCGAIIGQGAGGGVCCGYQPPAFNIEKEVRAGFRGGIREETDSSIILTSNRPGNSVVGHALADSQIPV